MEQHYGALEASWEAVYGRDLRADLWGPHTLGVRRLYALVVGLPPGCALHRAADPEAWAWNNDTELLAALVEQVSVGNVMFMAANSKKGTRTPKPIAVPRPGRLVKEREESKQARRVSMVEFFRGKSKGGDD